MSQPSTAELMQLLAECRAREQAMQAQLRQHRAQRDRHGAQALVSVNRIQHATFNQHATSARDSGGNDDDEIEPLPHEDDDEEQQEHIEGEASGGAGQQGGRQGGRKKGKGARAGKRGPQTPENKSIQQGLRSFCSIETFNTILVRRPHTQPQSPRLEEHLKHNWAIGEYWNHSTNTVSNDAGRGYLTNNAALVIWIVALARSFSRIVAGDLFQVRRVAGAESQ